METPTLKRILDPKSNIDDRHIPDHAALAKVVNTLKEQGFKIVLTQGVYDMIHEGHALYLEAAKSYGDVLVVGVDSDELTKKRKGPERPIVPYEERIKMLAHLRHVDIVTKRDAQEDIGNLIRLVKPDVLVTSSSTGDFTEALKKEYATFCGEIVTLPPQATTSTTARIRNLTMEGAQKFAAEVQKLAQSFLKGIHNSS